MGNAPARKFKSSISFGLQLAVWENGGNPTFSISKQYKDKNTGEWKESKSFFASDLAAIAMMAPEAIAYADSLRGSKSQGEAETKELVEPTFSKMVLPAEDLDVPF